MSNEGGNPWAWAGLLKWSLNHVDGTQDNSDAKPMSEEDKAFLEKVMRHGIVDEGDRMKFILSEATKAMEYYRSRSVDSKQALVEPPISEEALEDLLQELRDIVEQIDYARAFCSLQGLPFLLGCAQQTAVPEAIRVQCAGILSTLCQNNPPVQQQLLELGAIKTLSDLFLDKGTSNSMKARLMQAISSTVRNHEVGETVFSNLPQAPALLLAGLHPETASTSLRSKTLLFLRALVTSDAATPTRVNTFGVAIEVVRDFYLEESAEAELREMGIALLERLLSNKNGGVNLILQRKDVLAAKSVQRIAALRKLTGEDLEFAQVELEHWESFLVLLASAEQEQESTAQAEPLLLKM